MSSGSSMFDKTVVLTREPELCAALSKNITDLGGKVIVLPALEIQALETDTVLTPDFDVLIFVR